MPEKERTKAGYDAIVFDVDDVLVHFDRTAAAQWHDRMRALGIDMDDMDQIFTSLAVKGRLLTGGSLAEEVATRLARQHVSLDPATYLDGWFREGCIPDHELIAAIGDASRASGVPAFVATNNYPERKIFLWSSDFVGLCRQFRDIACSSDLGIMKTNPEFFYKAERRFGMQGKRLKFFDDNPEYVTCAQAAGWDAELVQASGGRALILDFLSTLVDPNPRPC